MSQTRLSSLSKFQKQRKSIASIKPLQPMTELYLREFFKNHFVTTNQKETQNMFNSSIQVLDYLISEYEQKFGIQNVQEEIKDNQTQGLEFQAFYNRLRNMLESVYENVLSLKTQSSRFKQQENCMSRPKSFQSYEDYLFPENSSRQARGHSKKSSVPQTDYQLYQLVVELKKQGEEDSLKIKSLEKQLKSKQKTLQNLEEKNKILQGEIKIIRKENQQLLDSLERNIQEKTQLSSKLADLQEKIKELKQNSEKNQVLILLKDEQIKRLELIEKAYTEVTKENVEFKEKLHDLSENCNIIQSEKIVLQNEIKQISSQEQKAKSENKKLRNIITKKLSLFPSDQSKQNMTSNLGSSKSPEDYIKELLSSILKNEKVLSKTIQTQLSAFIMNLIRKDNLLKNSSPSNKYGEQVVGK